MKHNSRLKILTGGFLILAIAGCGRETASPLADHDNKYRPLAGCVEDTASGLVWEVKLDETGLRNWRNTYTWHAPEEPHHELDYRGTPDGGKCAGSRCDTTSFVQAVNSATLCGFADWRMPSKDELFSISDLRKVDNPPTANMDFFPHTQAIEYWSGNDYSFQPDAAWAWNFRFGHDRVDWKREAKPVRLVRGESKELAQVKE
jgi:hypothetical protein